MSLAIEPIEFGFQLLNFGTKILACHFLKKNTALVFGCAYIYIYIMYGIFEYLKSGNSQKTCLSSPWRGSEAWRWLEIWRRVAGGLIGGAGAKWPIRGRGFSPGWKNFSQSFYHKDWFFTGMKRLFIDIFPKLSQSSYQRDVVFRVLFTLFPNELTEWWVCWLFHLMVSVLIFFHHVMKELTFHNVVKVQSLCCLCPSAVAQKSLTHDVSNCL